MRKSRFSGLGGVMRGQADVPAIAAQEPKNPPEEHPGDDDDEDEPDAGDGTSNEEPDMSEKPDTQAAVETARTEGHAAGFKAANERLGAVFASEHYAGREQLAQNLLGNASMDADAIISALAAAPKAAAPDGGGADPEEAARSEMRAAIVETANSDVDANGGKPGGGDKAKANSDAWARVYGDLSPKR
jgi:hypothetical protein